MQKNKEGYLSEGYAIAWGLKDRQGYVIAESIRAGTALFTKEVCQKQCEELNKELSTHLHWPEWNSKRLQKKNAKP